MAKRGRFRVAGLLSAVLLLYVLFLGIPSFIKLIYPLEHKELIIQYGQLREIDPPLLAALIKAESGFNSGAESSKGARGLMQITPSTGKWIAATTGVEDYDDSMLFDPEVNIRLGTWYIRHLSNYYQGNFELVFAAYNGGRGNVDKWLADRSLSNDGLTLDTIPFSETDNFVKRVKKYYDIYKRLYSWEADQ